MRLTEQSKTDKNACTICGFRVRTERGKKHHMKVHEVKEDTNEKEQPQPN